MTEKRFVPIDVVWIDGFIQDHEEGKDLFSANAVCDLLNELSEENKHLKQHLSECERKKQNLKTMLTNSEPVLEQKTLQKLIYKIVINMIDEKIKENRPTMLAVKIPKECADKRVCLHNHEVNVASMAKYNILNELKEELKGAADD